MSRFTPEFEAELLAAREAYRVACGIPMDQLTPEQFAAFDRWDRNTDEKIDILYEEVVALRAALKTTRRAVECALSVWCPRGDPGGDGADGDTWELCMESLGMRRDGTPLKTLNEQLAAMADRLVTR